MFVRNNSSEMIKTEEVGRPTLRGAYDELLDVLVEEEVCTVTNECGYNLYFGKEEEHLTNLHSVPPELESVDAPNLDIFGQVLGKKTTFEIQCPNCKRTLAAARFAPHLEKCMGMGRNSSRIASRRLAASAGNNSSAAFAISSIDTPRRVSPSPNIVSTTSTVTQAANGDIPSEDDHYEDVDDDEDWTMEKKRRGKRAVEKPSTKRKGSSGRSRRYVDSKVRRPTSPSVACPSSPPSVHEHTDEASNISTASSH